MHIPDTINALADEMYASAGVERVVVGGSRAIGRAKSTSDWDLGVYYRRSIELDALRARGDVHPPGAWGRVMNGGAWLQIDGIKVDVLLRDIDVVEHWTREADEGRYDVDSLLGYVAGVPTYSLAAEAAVARPIRGTAAARSDFPEALTVTGPRRWRIHRDFSLDYAMMHARRGNAIGVLGNAARAIFEEAHARSCERRRWVLNEKHLLDGCDLDPATSLLRTTTGLDTLVHSLRDHLLSS